MDDSIPMGLGAIASPDLIFVRKFRWTLSATNLPQHFMKKARFNFAQQQIEFEYYEIISPSRDDLHIQEWVERSDLNQEVMTLTTFDGCGKPLYRYDFRHIQLLEDSSEFDYSDSGESTRRIVVSYDSFERTYCAKEKEEVKYIKKGFDWTLSTGYGEEFDVKLSNRPQLPVEEIKISFLNDKTWLPGKAQWEILNISICPHDETKAITQLLGRNQLTLRLKLWSRGKNPVNLETWTLKNAEIQHTRREGGIYVILIRFTEAEYEQSH